jgi:uncharacterized integral membrane protein
MNVKIILIIAIAAAVVLFVIQNVGAVTVSIFFWKISLSLALLIFFTFASGFVIGWFLHSFLAYRKVKKEVAGITEDLKTGKP